MTDDSGTKARLDVILIALGFIIALLAVIAWRLG